jgi:hypothetical protein
MMQNYAAVICSLAIESRFPAEARLLESIEVEGWLTPTNGLIYIQPREVPRWVDEKLQLQLYEPGPQFLYFLERNVVKFTIEDPFVAEWSDLQQFMDGLNEESPVVFGGGIMADGSGCVVARNGVVLWDPLVRFRTKEGENRYGVVLCGEKNVLDLTE